MDSQQAGIAKVILVVNALTVAYRLISCLSMTSIIKMLIPKMMVSQQCYLTIDHGK